MHFICTSIVTTSVLAGTVFADTIEVCPSCVYTSIQDAIDASGPGDTINIAAGTYYEADLDPGGRSITIRGTLDGAGSPATSIDAQQSGNVFTFVSGEDAGTVISNLVITGGGNATIDGGGIYCNQSSPTITGCTINGNLSNNRGGGISCYNNSAPTLSACIISDNTAEQGGGIHCNNSNPDISDCTIAGNIATQEGGGIHCYNNGNPAVSRCTIADNDGQSGAGIYCQESAPTISECSITGGTAIEGGAISCWFESIPIITGCTISDNEAQYAGGIYSYESNPAITDCRISGNTATNYGGGLYCQTTPAVITSSVFCGNTPDQVDGDPAPSTDGSLVSDTCWFVGSTGACCVSSGCQPLADDDCTALGGTWLGEGGSCDDCAPACQGDVNDDGTVNVLDLLKVIEGWGSCP